MEKKEKGKKEDKVNKRWANGNEKEKKGNWGEVNEEYDILDEEKVIDRVNVEKKEICQCGEERDK